MKQTKTYFQMVQNLIRAGLRNTSLGETGIIEGEAIIANCLMIRRLAKKHHRLAEMSCNGYGYVNGQSYYNGTIDDYARREYGYNVKSAYVEDDVDVFDVESERVQKKIADIVNFKLGKDWHVEFQGDPRGNTVKLFFKDRYIDINY